jgi:hypothetical protein
LCAGGAAAAGRALEVGVRSKGLGFSVEGLGLRVEG